MPATAIDVADLASRLRVRVTRLARKLRRENAEISPTLVSGLATIERHGPMTAGGFATHEQISKPTATHMIGSLLERGFIERTPDPLDGRVVWLQLSADGRRLLQRIRRRNDEYLAQRMRGLSNAELATLERAADLLERLTEEEK